MPGQQQVNLEISVRLATAMLQTAAEAPRARAMVRLSRLLVRDFSMFFGVFLIVFFITLFLSFFVFVALFDRRS
jgi:hypothetical protein